ncbi:MAG: DUF4340 domain-containing protein [Bacteroidota bacterium]
MKKTNIIILSSLLVLIVLAIILFFTRYNVIKTEDDGLKIKRKSTTLEVLRDFAVKDTASVDKIFLVDKDNNRILLERQAKDKWRVNDKYYAREDFINLLLKTIHRIEISNPVPKAKQEYVLRNLSGNSVKCEIYQDGELSKTYYVGGVTQDNLGTYMLLENSSAAFEVYIPGFNGFLTTRYNTSEDEWRSKRVFSYDLKNIAQVKIEYPESPEESLIAINKGENKYALKAAETGELMPRFDTVGVKMLISRFRKVGLEYFLPEEEQAHHYDSLTALTPMQIFTLTDKSGNDKKLRCYKRPNYKEQLDEQGNPYEYDTERLYGVTDGEVCVMQYHTVDPLSVRLSDLLPPASRN